MKSGAYLSQTLTDPVTAHSQDPNETSIQRAFRFEGTRWEFLERPENLFMFRRYGAAMSGAAKLQPPWAVLTSKLVTIVCSLVRETDPPRLRLGIIPGRNCLCRRWGRYRQLHSRDCQDSTRLYLHPRGPPSCDGKGKEGINFAISGQKPSLTLYLQYWEHQASELYATGNVHFIGTVANPSEEDYTEIDLCTRSRLLRASTRTPSYSRRLFHAYDPSRLVGSVCKQDPD